MGLGKTLQGIALLWTLLRAGNAALGGTPIAKRVIIVCPTSLVNNWDSECAKWLKVRGAAARPSGQADAMSAMHFSVHAPSAQLGEEHASDCHFSGSWVQCNERDT